MLKETVRRIIGSAGLSAEQELVLIYDSTTADIEAAFSDAVATMLANQGLKSYNRFNLDSYERPLGAVPDEIREAVLKADLLLMLISKIADDRADEHITFRKPVIDLKYENKKLRVGSILDVTSDLFIEAFRYDPEKVKKLNKRLYGLISKSEDIQIKTPAGTDLKMKVGSLKWINQDADLSKPSPQHSLLAGEVYGCPEGVEGIMVVDGIMGGRFMRHGDLGETPLNLEISGSKVVSVSCKNLQLQEEFKSHITQYENAERVGELGFGTNTGLKRFYGVLGIDEKFPGNHIAFGHPYSEKTQASWKSPVHVDCVLRKCDTWIGKKQVLKKGKYPDSLTL